MYETLGILVKKSRMVICKLQCGINNINLFIYFTYLSFVPILVGFQTENFAAKTRTLPVEREREDDLKKLLGPEKSSSMLLPGAKARKRYSLGKYTTFLTD